MIRTALIVLAGGALSAILLSPFSQPFLMPPLSALLPKPAGFPSDARITESNFKDGTWWSYCRDLPSGVVYVGGKADMISDPLISFRYEGRCPWFPISWPGSHSWGDLIESRDTPSFLVSQGGIMFFAIPEAQSGDFHSTCSAEFKRAFYDKASKILIESEALADDPIRANAGRLALALAILKDPEVRSLAARSGELQFCRVEKRKSPLG